jgi:hypothetical protein
VAKALTKAADPNAKTLWVFTDAGPVHEWVEATIHRDHPSSRINHPGCSGLYPGDPVHSHMDPPGDLGTLQVPTLSGRHHISPGPKQGEKEDTLFDTRVLSESQVRDHLTPAGLGNAVQKRLAGQLADMVAQPGRNLTTDGESELTGIADILRGHQSENQVGMGGQTPAPHQQVKCTTIRKCKTYDSLVKRCGNLVELRSKLLSTMLGNLGSVLMMAGWDEGTALEDARNGLIFRIAQETLDYYVSLRGHLVQIGMVNFDMAKSELDHHIEKMQQIRALDGSRLQYMCQLYIYLQVGAFRTF